MQELRGHDLNDVSGGLSQWLTILTLGTTGTWLDRAVDAFVGFVASGDAPDYSRTTSMGDMY